MKRNLSLAVLLVFATFMSLKSQCFTDRHNTTASASWVSCTPSASPNSARPAGHWIAYDLGALTGLGKTTIWNLNNPAHLTSGAKTIHIDYSLDGINWTYFNSFEIPMAAASGFYEGEVGIDFENLTTQHLLLTVTDNHGGDCFGFAEIKIERLDPVDTDDLLDEVAMSLYPSPAIDHAFLEFEHLAAEQAELSIMDAKGAELQTRMVTLEAGSNKIRISLAHYDSGQYFVRLKTKTKLMTKELTLIKN